MAKKQIKPRRKKFRTVALAIAFAIAVWFAVIYVNDPDITTTISGLDVRIVGETSLRERQLAVTGRDDIPELSVVVTGKRSDLISAMDNIHVQVDVTNMNTAGNYNLIGSISLPTNRITVEKENFKEIPLTIEKLEEKEIEVTVKQTGTLKNKLVQSQIANPKITISGAASEIELVHGAVATVDISKLESDRIDRVNYLLVNEAGELITTNETLESTLSRVDVENTIYEAKTLPVEPALSAELDKDYILRKNSSTVIPTTVTVGVDENLAVDKVIARIDVLDSADGTYALESVNGMYIPPEIKHVKIKPDIVKKSVKELELNVSATNAPDGRVTRVSEPVRALVWSDNPDIAAENVQAEVDLAGLGSGIYTLPVRIVGENVGLMQEVTVLVAID